MGSLLNKSDGTETGSPVENERSSKPMMSARKMPSDIKDKSKSEGDPKFLPPKKKTRLTGGDRELYELTWSPVLGPSDLSGVISRSKSRSLRPLKSRPLPEMAPSAQPEKKTPEIPETACLTPDCAATTEEVGTGNSPPSSPTPSHETETPSNWIQGGFEEQVDIANPTGEEEEVEQEPEIQESSSSATAADPLEPELILMDYDDSDDEAPESPTVTFEDSSEEFDLDEEDSEEEEAPNQEEIEVLDISDSDDSEDENVTELYKSQPLIQIPSRVPSIVISLERSYLKDEV